MDNIVSRESGPCESCTSSKSVIRVVKVDGGYRVADVCHDCNAVFSYVTGVCDERAVAVSLMIGRKTRRLQMKEAIKVVKSVFGNGTKVVKETIDGTCKISEPAVSKLKQGIESVGKGAVSLGGKIKDVHLVSKTKDVSGRAFARIKDLASGAVDGVNRHVKERVAVKNESREMDEATQKMIVDIHSIVSEINDKLNKS